MENVKWQVKCKKQNTKDFYIVILSVFCIFFFLEKFRNIDASKYSNGERDTKMRGTEDGGVDKVVT